MPRKKSFNNWQKSEAGQTKLKLTNKVILKLKRLALKKHRYEGVVWSPDDMQYLIFSRVDTKTKGVVVKLIGYSNDELEAAVIYDNFIYTYFEKCPNLDAGKYTLEDLKVNFIVNHPKFYTPRIRRKLSRGLLAGISVFSFSFFKVKVNSKIIGIYASLLEAIQAQNKFILDENLPRENMIDIERFKEGKYGYPRGSAGPT